MFKLLFSALLTLLFVYPADANLIAAYDFESENSTPATLRKARRIPEGKYGNALMIQNEHWGASEIHHRLDITDHTISFVAWVRLNFGNDSGPLSFIFERGNLNRTLSTRLLEIRSNGALRLTAHAGATTLEVESEAQAVLLDHNWHHIAYSSHLDVHKFFVDGEVVFETKERTPKIVGFVSFITIGDLFGLFEGKAFVDEVGVFGNHLSDETVRFLYNHPLSQFLSALRIDPKGTASTTWGAIKSD